MCVRGTALLRRKYLSDPLPPEQLPTATTVPTAFSRASPQAVPLKHTSLHRRPLQPRFCCRSFLTLWRCHFPDGDSSLNHEVTQHWPRPPLSLMFSEPFCCRPVCKSLSVSHWLIIYLLSDLAEKVAGHNLPLLDELL